MTSFFPMGAWGFQEFLYSHSWQRIGFAQYLKNEIKKPKQTHPYSQTQPPSFCNIFRLGDLEHGEIIGHLKRQACLTFTGI